MAAKKSENPPAAVEYAVHAETGLYLRTGPGREFPPVAVLPDGCGVFAAPGEGGGDAPDWMAVRTGTLTGYAAAAFLGPVRKS